MTFRFGSWNVNNRRLTGDHADFLRRVDVDVLALQEVSVEFHAKLDALRMFDWSISGLVLRPPAISEGRARRLGCSIFGRSPFRLIASGVFGQLAFPERALIAI